VSVSTLRQLAPCCQQVRAIATGSNSARMTRAEGLAFLISAMSRMGPGPVRAMRKLRTGGATAARVSSSSSDSRRRAASTSTRFEATISSRIVIVIPCLNPSNHVVVTVSMSRWSRWSERASSSHVVPPKAKLRMRVPNNVTQGYCAGRGGALTDWPVSVTARESMWDMPRAPVLGAGRPKSLEDPCLRNGRNEL